MDRIELGLNGRKPGNYGFFCPVSRLHLTVSNPTGSVDGVTPAILRGLKSRVLVDIKGVINLETGKVNKVKPEVPKEDTPAKTTEVPKQASEDNVKEEVVEEVKVAPEAETKPTKRGKRASTKPVDEAAEQTEE